MKDISKQKALFLIAVSILLISSCAAMYFCSVIEHLEDEQSRTRARELASAIAANIDMDLVRHLRTDVELTHGWSKEPVDNRAGRSRELNEYLEQYEGIDAKPEYQEVYHWLYDLLYATEVDSIYLAYLDRQTEAMVYMVDVGMENLRRPGSFDYLRGEDLKAIDDGFRTIGASVADTDTYGNIIGMAVPVHSDGGDAAIAYVGVDIRMDAIDAQRRRILMNAVLLVIVTTLMICAVSLYFTGRMLSEPMDTETVLAEEETKKNTRISAKKAKEEKKIDELKESLSELFMNMPALTFSKDVITGKYLACNQMFAEYAHKGTPERVVGLTDEEIFGAKQAAKLRESDEATLAMKGPNIFNEEVEDASGNIISLQTTKLQFMDANGRFCILGMSLDMTEMTMAKRESAKTMEAYQKVQNTALNYSRIARALASDYTFVYYVDLRSDTYKSYSSSNEEVGMEIAEEGADFFNLSRHNARELIYAPDLGYFLGLFTKENITKSIRDRGQFVVTYRLMINGEPTYVGMRAVFPEDDIDHIIIGVHNIEAQVLENEMRITS